MFLIVYASSCYCANLLKGMEMYSSTTHKGYFTFQFTLNTTFN